MNYQTIGDVAYHIKGNHPRLIIHSGTHGDEFHLIEPLKEVINEIYHELPDFLYVPEVSPSAVRAKSRINALGNDMNRVFWKENSDPEVKANKQILALASHALAITFHEDIELNKYYLYDSGELTAMQLDWLRTRLTQNNIPLLNGLDDPEDEHLCHHFIDGYLSIPGRPRFEGQFVDDWARYHSHVDRMLTVEIPYEGVDIKHCLVTTLRLGLELIQSADEKKVAVIEDDVLGELGEP